MTMEYHGDATPLQRDVTTMASMFEGVLSLRDQFSCLELGTLATMHADAAERYVEMGTVIELGEKAPGATERNRFISYSMTMALIGEAADRQEPNAQPPHSERFLMAAREAHGKAFDL